MPYLLRGLVLGVNKGSTFGRCPIAIEFRNSRGYMDSEVDVSCWGVTMKAVLAFGAILAIVYFFGAFDPVAITAS